MAMGMCDLRIGLVNRSMGLILVPLLKWLFVIYNFSGGIIGYL
jgi:hypothetical protein